MILVLNMKPLTRSKQRVEKTTSTELIKTILSVKLLINASQNREQKTTGMKHSSKIIFLSVKLVRKTTPGAKYIHPYDPLSATLFQKQRVEKFMIQTIFLKPHVKLLRDRISKLLIRHPSHCHHHSLSSHPGKLTKPPALFPPLTPIIN